MSRDPKSRFNPLDRDVQFVRGVGPRRAELFERLGVKVARDLLYHTPRRYEDASTVTPVASLETGMDTSIIGRVVSKGVIPTRRGLRIFQAMVRDASGYVECSWPGQPFLDRVVERGDLLLLTGTVRFFHGKQFHPREFTTLSSDDDDLGAEEGIVYPIYPATEGLTHRQIRQLIADNLDELVAAVEAEDSLPPVLLERTGVPALAEALTLLHRPPSVGAVQVGRRRLALDELFYLQLIHARSHREATAEAIGIALPPGDTLVRALWNRLPFELTGAQIRVLREIGADMAAPRRMNRLLQGDVGSGKTVVALFAALRAAENGYQTAVLAPTEILAEQHARSMGAMLEGIDVGITLLTGRMPAARRREALLRIGSGEAAIVVGTHALIQESVTFHKLGLAIVDEQHRFGVLQRLALTEVGGGSGSEPAPQPDFLLMSATPIPRSLALTRYGDLDLSILDERPPGRGRIRTALRSPAQLDQVLAFVRDQVAEGRQAFVVYPLVEESDAVDLKSATEQFDRLVEGPLKGLRLGLLHGQMRSEEKDGAMRAFADGQIDVLVATTVIEVGIDVPNATVMVIEHAERFGLSQLHQLRGRVGRGAAESYCILLSHPGPALERLRIFAGTEDGFRIAEEDLRLRGQGDLFGSRQSGIPAFRWADLQTDADLLNAARDEARTVIESDPDLVAHPRMLDVLQRQYADAAKLFGSG